MGVRLHQAAEKVGIRLRFEGARLQPRRNYHNINAALAAEGVRCRSFNNFSAACSGEPQEFAAGPNIEVVEAPLPDVLRSARDIDELGRGGMGRRRIQIRTRRANPSFKACMTAEGVRSCGSLISRCRCR